MSAYASGTVSVATRSSCIDTLDGQRSAALYHFGCGRWQRVEVMFPK